MDICQGEGIEPDRKEVVRLAPVDFDKGLTGAISDSASFLSYSSINMTSGAGHDAQLIAGRFPAAMIFIASKDGLSHNIKEYSSPGDIEKGANVLLHTLLRLDD